MPRSMIKAAIAFAAFHLFAGCGTTPDERPISDSLLVEILADLHVEEARINHGLTGVVSRDTILARYGANEAELNRTLDSFSEDLAAYLRLYDRVIGELSERYAREGDDGADTLETSSSAPSN